MSMNKQQGWIHSKTRFAEFTITIVYLGKVCEFVFNGGIRYLLTPMCRRNTLKLSHQIQPVSFSLT